MWLIYLYFVIGFILSAIMIQEEYEILKKDISKANISNFIRDTLVILMCVLLCWPISLLAYLIAEIIPEFLAQKIYDRLKDK